MEFDRDNYRATLIKILDLARDGHQYTLERVTALQVDIAKTYLWVASVESGVAMFLVKEPGGLSFYPTLSLSVAIGFASLAFMLSLLVLWGRGHVSSAFTEPMKLADFAHTQFSVAADADTQVLAGLIGSIDDANRENEARNKRRVRILRMAAPLLFVSFLLLIATLLLRLYRV